MEHKARLKRSYMVMQDVNYELFAESVEAECSFGIRNPDQDLVETTMAELGLTAYRERHPNTLSGGQKQRAAVARALITGPQLILADEPTGALDSRAADSLLRLFGEINAGGQTILMVTHSIRAASSARRVLFLSLIHI